MDQSLRTVATQLLNVTNPEDSKDGKDKPKISKEEIPTNVLLVRKQDTKTNNVPNGNQQNFETNTKSDMELVKEINSEISSLESMGVGFGRPMNSKFGYFESSHPGEAMAMTEEELEREMMTSSSTRLITAHKNHPTTTGGISTWILLNSPTTTSKPIQDHNNDGKEINVEVRLKTKLTTPVHIFESTLKTDMRTAATADKTVPLQSSGTPFQKVATLTKITTPILKETTIAMRPTTTTVKPVKPTRNSTKTDKTKGSQTASTLKSPSSVTSSSATTNIVTTTVKPNVTTKKAGNSSRGTSKPKVTTPKSTVVTSKPMTTKIGRPNQSGKPKTTPTRKVTPKPSVETTKNGSASKIEKVTFRPVQMITTPKSSVESVERPMFVTKMKTSVFTDSNSKPTSANTLSVTQSSKFKTEEIKSNFSDGDLVEISTKSKPQTTKTNNVLKVQLKKPTESPTKIEIEPIKVNAPVLRIEKIEDKEKVIKKDVTKIGDSVLDNSRIDLKFDFNPELTKIDVETSTASSSTVATTKRPHKRKKNKIRRRKPTTSTATSIATPETTLASITLNPTTIPTSTEIDEILNLTELGIGDNSIQESKIVPETKVVTNNTKNKKKQVQKPIGTQIYNFLSREVMPSFGVMSLVGLGLGIASYFLYPFGGAIARRNYVVEPNYKYNLDEYGGNYGQNEEEVFSKVLQGMTNNDGKYGGIKDYENNFYRYQQFDGAYTDSQTTRRGDPRYPTSSATNYRPIDTTVYDSKYRNTEFMYPDVSTTSNYYDRRKQPEFVGNKHGNGDRQFVVGNVPKEYGYDEKRPSNLPTTTEIVKTDFERGVAQKYKISKNPANISPTYGQAEAQALKADQGYEDIDITPTAVVVEHGPRSLKIDLPKSRRKRDSVIQLIPSRTEIEKEEKEIEEEEPLSNEILDIIDSVIPGEMGIGTVSKINHEKDEDNKKHEIEKKAVEEEKRQGVVASPESEASKNSTTSTSTTLSSISSTSTTTSTTIQSLTIDELIDTSTKSDGNHSEDPSVEWFDESTTVKPHEEHFNVFNFVKKVAEIKFRLGLTILKHASEGFARYLGHVQKRINGEE